MSEPLAIATDMASVQAQMFVVQERDRTQPLATSYVVQRIVSEIGQALFEAGYGYHGVSFEQRKALAEAALSAVGYGDLQKGQGIH